MFKDNRNRIVKTMIDKRALTDEETARYIGMSESFLRQSRMNGDRHNRTPGPKYLKIGRAVRYLKEDLDIWLEQHRVEPNKPKY